MTALAWWLGLIIARSVAEEYVAWSSVSAVAGGPGGRVGMASTSKSLAETAALGDQLWIFGGIASAVPPTYSAELWMFDVRSSTWTQEEATGGPPALEGSAMCAVRCWPHPLWPPHVL